MSLDLDPMSTDVLAHPVTSSWLYLHLFNKALWFLNDMTRSTRVLLVHGCRSATAGVFYWVQIGAAGLWDAACLGVALAVDGCVTEWVLADQLPRLREW